jgi:flagellar hook-length control protein FliK
VHEALAAGEAVPPAAHSAAAHVRAERGATALRLADTAVQLQELADVAVSRGAAHARLALHPAELGGIEVRLRVTAEGLTASIAAERPEAVQALQQAGAELRRALEQRGVTVLSVDVSLAGAAGGHEAGQHAHAGADRSSSGGGRTEPNGGQEAAADAMEAEPTEPRSVPAGALVDVLA